jgi:hypothetical protein
MALPNLIEADRIVRIKAREIGANVYLDFGEDHAAMLQVKESIDELDALIAAAGARSASVALALVKALTEISNMTPPARHPIGEPITKRGRPKNKPEGEPLPLGDRAPTRCRAQRGRAMKPGRVDCNRSARRAHARCRQRDRGRERAGARANQAHPNLRGLVLGDGRTVIAIILRRSSPGSTSTPARSLDETTPAVLPASRSKPHGGSRRTPTQGIERR